MKFYFQLKHYLEAQNILKHSLEAQNILNQQSRISFHKSRMKSILLNEQCEWADSVLCNSLTLGDDLPATWTLPDSLEPFTKSHKKATTWVSTNSLNPQHWNSQTFRLYCTVHEFVMLQLSLTVQCQMGNKYWRMNLEGVVRKQSHASWGIILPTVWRGWTEPLKPHPKVAKDQAETWIRQLLITSLEYCHYTSTSGNPESMISHKPPSVMSKGYHQNYVQDA
jgi:hypothetical protein